MKDRVGLEWGGGCGGERWRFGVGEFGMESEFGGEVCVGGVEGDGWDEGKCGVVFE